MFLDLLRNRFVHFKHSDFYRVGIGIDISTAVTLDNNTLESEQTGAVVGIRMIEVLTSAVTLPGTGWSRLMQ